MWAQVTSATKSKKKHIPAQRIDIRDISNTVSAPCFDTSSIDIHINLHIWKHDMDNSIRICLTTDYESALRGLATQRIDEAQHPQTWTL